MKILTEILFTSTNNPYNLHQLFTGFFFYNKQFVSKYLNIKKLPFLEELPLCPLQVPLTTKHQEMYMLLVEVRVILLQVHFLFLLSIHNQFFFGRE